MARLRATAQGFDEHTNRSHKPAARLGSLDAAVTITTQDDQTPGIRPTYVRADVTRNGSVTITIKRIEPDGTTKHVAIHATAEGQPMAISTAVISPFGGTL